MATSSLQANLYVLHSYEDYPVEVIALFKKRDVLYNDDNYLCMHVCI